VQAIQTIVSRNHFAFDELVISVTQIHAGTVDNVIPDTAWVQATVRSFSKDVQAMVIKRLQEIWDFAYFFEKRPGAYLFVGNGPSAGLHHPKYDFNDEAAAHGASFFARLVETAQPVV